jgi:hypothetical protein
VDYETEKENLNISTNRSIMMISLMGGTGIIIPFISIFVATFKGVTELSMLNSSALLILSVLMIIFIVTRSASAYFNGNQKLAVFGIVFIVANILSLIYNLIIYMVL